MGGRSATVSSFEQLGCFVKFACFTSDESWNPVHGAEFIEHCTANTRHAVGFEFDPAFHIESVDGIHQAKDPGADQVVEFDPFREFGPQSFTVVADERGVSFNQSIPQFDAGRIRFEFRPDLSHVDILYGSCRHSNLHAFLAISSCATW